MRVETYPTIFDGVRKIIFSLHSHKRESDRQFKHEAWSGQKHIVLTSLAILTDVGFNASAIMLAVSGNLLQAGLLKYVHYKGAETLPHPVANFTNKFFKRKKS